MLLSHYLGKLGYPFIPPFLIKYLRCPSLKRLKDVGYFCGMDYASKKIYNFREYISRYDHSLTTSLIVYNLTRDKKATIAALFHDVATPCFSHVIDYMNKDYMNQESTEEYTEKIIRSDEYLKKCLEIDNIDIEDIINFKKYSVVDNDRPKLCADRLDGIILTGIGWTKSIHINDIDNILRNSVIYINEDNEQEIGFCDQDVANMVVSNAELIDEYCHTYEDNYMMDYLSWITKAAINRNIITYDDLYKLTEKELFKLLKSSNDKQIYTMLYSFKNMKKEDVLNIYNFESKKRILKPLCNGKRMK